MKNLQALLLIAALYLAYNELRARGAFGALIPRTFPDETPTVNTPYLADLRQRIGGGGFI